MKRLLLSASRAAVLFVFAGSGCLLDGGSLAGKSCETVNDCPPELVCVFARPGQGRTCEALSGPEHGDTSEKTETGPAYWCGDDGIAQILTTYCAGCHGETVQSGGAFRLDRYEDADGLEGAFAKLERIKARALDQPRTMPLAGSPAPTSEELSKLHAWIRNGGPLCTPDLSDAGS